MLERVITSRRQGVHLMLRLRAWWAQKRRSDRLLRTSSFKRRPVVFASCVWTSAQWCQAQQRATTCNRACRSSSVTHADHSSSGAVFCSGGSPKLPQIWTHIPPKYIDHIDDIYRDIFCISSSPDMDPLVQYQRLRYALNLLDMSDIRVPLSVPMIRKFLSPICSILTMI